MRHGDGVEAIRGRAEVAAGMVGIGQGAGVAVGVGAVVLVLAVGIVVLATQPVWHLLGAGRGLVPEEYYHLSGVVIVTAMALGQFAGVFIGTGVLAYLWHLLGKTVAPSVIRGAMTLAYLGLVPLPLLFFHLLFAQPLAGIPRDELAEWVLANHPDAYGLLFPGHTVVDYSIIPLALVFLLVLWGLGDRVLRSRGPQILLTLIVTVSALAAALSLALHSTLVHIRIG